jgi:hypothetical protein
MGINVHENTIHPELIENLKEECHKIDSYVKQSGTLKDGKYTTFWLHKDDEPQTLIEYLVKQISYQDFPNGFPENYVGMEWWSQIRDTNEGITFHYDKDEAICSEKKIYNYPLKSTITYLTDIGGPTTIFSDENYNKGYLSFPKVNKHVRFDGHLFHGVIGPLGENKPNKKDKRITLLINYWNYRPEEPNCIVFTKNNILLPLEENHKELQGSVEKEHSKIIKMNYKNGYREWKIFRTNTPHLLKFAKHLKKNYTYSFNFIKDCVAF